MVVLTCFAMYGCVYVWVCVCVGFVKRGCFGNTRTCVFTVFCIVCTVFFVLFRSCIFLFALSVLV